MMFIYIITGRRDTRYYQIDLSKFPEPPLRPQLEEDDERFLEPIRTFTHF